MIYLNYERDFMSVFPRHHCERTKCGSHAVAAAFDRKLYDIFRVEVRWIFRERCASAVFNSLVNRKNGNKTGVRQTACSIQSLKTAKYLRIPICLSKNSVNKIRARKMKLFFGDRFTLMP